MFPILGRFGPLVIYSYTAVLSLGAALGLGVAAYRNKSVKLPDWPDGMLAGLAMGLLGGRAGFVWMEWGYFQARPSQIFHIWQGGLSYHGALLGGLAGVWLWSRWRGRPFAAIAALIAPLLPLGSGFGWLACWLEGCGYGRQAPLGWLTADLPDAFGLFAVRYQTQLLGIFASLLLFGWLWRRANWPPLRQLAFSLGWLSLAHAGIGVLRGDTAVFLGNIRLDILLDLLLAFLSLLLQKYAKTRRS